MFSERNQTRKDKCRMIPLTRDTYNRHLQGDRKQNDGCQDQEGGDGEVAFNQDRVSVWGT